MATASTGDESIVVVQRISSSRLFFVFFAAICRLYPNPVQAKVSLRMGPTSTVLLPRGLANGGIQGFKWYWRELKVDKDGDIADEFFDNIISFSCSSK